MIGIRFFEKICCYISGLARLQERGCIFPFGAQREECARCQPWREVSPPWSDLAASTTTHLQEAPATPPPSHGHHWEEEQLCLEASPSARGRQTLVLAFMHLREEEDPRGWIQEAEMQSSRAVGKKKKKKKKKKNCKGWRDWASEVKLRPAHVQVSVAWIDWAEGHRYKREGWCHSELPL